MKNTQILVDKVNLIKLLFEASNMKLKLSYLVLKQWQIKKLHGKVVSTMFMFHSSYDLSFI